MQESPRIEVSARTLEKQQVSFADEEDLNTVKSILEAHSFKRSMQEIAFLRNAFKNIKYFNDLLEMVDDKLQETILREVRVVTYPKSRTVFEAGATGRNFYMLLKGSVYILAKSAAEKVIAKDQRAQRKKAATKAVTGNKNGESSAGAQSLKADSNADGDGEVPAQNKPKQASNTSTRKESVLRVLDMKDTPKESANENIDPDSTDIILISKEKDREIFSENALMAAYPNFTRLATLFAPNYFGEIALNTQQARTATVVCREECILATLSGVTYNRILGEHYEAKNKVELDFFAKVPLVANWPIASLSAIIRGYVHRKLCKGERIYKQGEEANSLFFVKCGEIELMKKALLHSDKKERTLLMPYTTKITTSGKEALERLNSVWRSQINFKNEIHVAILGGGEIFGDTDLVADIRKREYTAICYSATAELYEVDRKVFFSNASNPEKLVQELREYNHKTFWRYNFANEIKQTNIKYALDIENIKKSQRVIDDGMIHLKEKISGCLHGDEEVDHVIRERNLKKPQEWPQFQVYDMSSGKSIFEQNRLFEKRSRFHRNSSQSQINNQTSRNEASPREKHIGRSSSTDNILTPLMSSNVTRIEEPSNKSTARVSFNNSTIINSTKRSQAQQKSVDPLLDCQSISPQSTNRSKPLKKKLSLPRLRSDSMAQVQLSGANSSKFSQSTDRTGGISPNSSLIVRQSLLMAVNRLTGIKEQRSFSKNVFALTEPNREDRMNRIMQELNKKDAMVQNLHKRLKIPELMSEASAYIHKLQSPRVQKRSSVRSKSTDVAFYAINESGPVMIPTNSNTLGTTTLQKITEISLELPPIKRTVPLRLAKSSMNLSKINISLEPSKDSIERG